MEEEDNFSNAVVGEDTSTVVGGDEGVDDAATAWPSLRASVSSGSGSVAVPSLPPHDRQLSQSAASQRAAMLVQTNLTTSGQHSSSSALSATGHCPPTHITPLSRPRTQQQGNGPDSPGDRTGNIMALMILIKFRTGTNNDKNKLRDAKNYVCRWSCSISRCNNNRTR